MDPPFTLRVKLFTGPDQLWSSTGKPKLERCIKDAGVAIFLGFILWPRCIALLKKNMPGVHTVQRQQEGLFLTFGGYSFSSMHCMKYELCDIQDTKLLWPLVSQTKILPVLLLRSFSGIIYSNHSQLYCKEVNSIVVCIVWYVNAEFWFWVKQTYRLCR